MAIEAFDPFGSDDDDDLAASHFDISPKNIDFSDSTPFHPTFAYETLTHIDPPPPPPLPPNRSDAFRHMSSSPHTGIQTEQKADQIQSGGYHSVNYNKFNTSQHTLVNDNILQSVDSFSAMVLSDEFEDDVILSNKFCSLEFDTNIGNDSKSRVSNVQLNDDSGEFSDSKGKSTQYVTPVQKIPPSEEIVFTVLEEMSTIHDAKTKQYKLSVRGILTVRGFCFT